MADTASLKEILFRHSAEQCKVCEAMNEIATVMNEEEFGYFLKSFEKKADLKSLSLISRRCQVVDTLCGLQSDTVLTVGQIKQLFELAK